jgi:hypothetical protein
MRAVVILLFVACDAGRAAPAPPPTAPGSGAPPAQNGPDARLVRSFDPAIVGKLTPQPVVAGDYAMALDLTFNSFVTMELEIDARVTGALQLGLAADGTATACLAVRASDGSSGDYHYQPPEKRTPYHEHTSTTLQVMTGTWKRTGNLATLEFTAVGYHTCDPSKVAPASQTMLALTCVATAATAKLPAGAIACEQPSDAVELGMPMAKPGPGPFPPAHDRPRGRQLVLAPGGLHVKVEQDSHATSPHFTFAPGAVAIDPKTYEPPPRKQP